MVRFHMVTSLNCGPFGGRSNKEGSQQGTIILRTDRLGFECMQLGGCAIHSAPIYESLDSQAFMAASVKTSWPKVASLGEVSLNPKP